MTQRTAKRAKETLAKTLREVVSRRERVVIRRNGKDVAAIVPLEDLDLLRRLEDRLDNDGADAALREPGPSVPWEKVKARPGLR